MQKLKMILIPVLLFGLLFVNPSMNVYAKTAAVDELPPTEPIPSPEAARPLVEKAERMLTRAFNAMGRLETHIGRDLDRADQIEERVTQLISHLEDQGKDSTEIQAALNGFMAGMPNLEASYADGQALYAQHDGFDDEGQVLDAEAAAETIRQIKDSFSETHRGWHEATRTLRDVLQAYREANSPTE